MADDNGLHPDADHNARSGADQAELSLTAIIKALDSGEPMPPEAQNSGSLAAFDPNATVNYQQAGTAYPELPFADEEEIPFDDVAPPEPLQRSFDRQAVAGRGIDNAGAAGGFLPKRGALSGSRQDQTATRSAHPAAGALARTETRKTRTPLEGSGYDSPASSYRPLNMRNASYRIRGGGGSKIPTPLVFVLSAVFAVVGIGLLWFGVTQVSGWLFASSDSEEPALTAAETRAALDARIPQLTNYLDTSIEDTSAGLIAAGQYLHTNGRYNPDSPDPSAAGSEFVSMPKEMSEEQMVGYYEGAYNAYSPEELEDSFNGSYVLDLARGDLGNWNKLKYVNLNATSINEEMEHIATLQGLLGEGVTVVAEGTDANGNTVTLGTKVIAGEAGERTFYFQIAACPFSEVYNANTISESSVYVTCTLATYDFYTNEDGTTNITPVA